MDSMFRGCLIACFLVACGGVVTSNDAGGPGPVDAATTAEASATAGRGIACGNATCAAVSEECCIDKSSKSCVPSISSCSGPVFRIQCDDATDCPDKGVCCFTNILQSAEIATSCMPSCNGGAGTTQLCTRSSDCPNGVCKTYTCGGSFGAGTITLGLCIDMAPMFCK